MSETNDKTTMDRLYNVTIEYLGLKKQDKFLHSTICLGKDGTLLIMDADGNRVRFVAKDCRVEQIAAHVIIVSGYTDKPQHVTAYCVYSGASQQARRSRSLQPDVGAFDSEQKGT
jgi:hypothetical protein